LHIAFIAILFNAWHAFFFSGYPLARVATGVNFIAKFVDHLNAIAANIMESLFLRQRAMIEAQVSSAESALHGF